MCALTSYYVVCLDWKMHSYEIFITVGGGVDHVCLSASSMRSSLSSLLSVAVLMMYGMMKMIVIVVIIIIVIVIRMFQAWHSICQKYSIVGFMQELADWQQLQVLAD